MLARLGAAEGERATTGPGGSATAPRPASQSARNCKFGLIDAGEDRDGRAEWRVCVPLAKETDAAQGQPARVAVASKVATTSTKERIDRALEWSTVRIAGRITV